MKNRTRADVKDFFFGSSLDFQWKIGHFFALPLRTALGFKIFSNAALCVKSLPIPAKLTWSIFGPFRPPAVSSVTKRTDYRCGRSGFDSRASQIATVSPTARHRCDISSELQPWHLVAEISPATRCMLRRNTASMMKI